ncbi:MAG: hypothetical protein RL154_601 [Pseudomonadota bacterium]|jgi:23S rRNA (adenine2503-C2)-methyltransferase
MQSIYDFTRHDLQQRFSPKFRADQIYTWLYKKYADTFAEMTDLSDALRAELEEDYDFCPLTLDIKQVSIDGSEKWRFRTFDNEYIETALVLMKEAEEGSSAEWTICVSSQIGCKIGCAFCATGKQGFVRNLSAGEIVSQVLLAKKLKSIKATKGVNVVFMGMGEPLDTLIDVIKSIKIMTDEKGLGLSPKRITVSTSGIAGKIESLANANLGINLAISLHAVDNTTRDILVPLNKAYNIETILEAVRHFPSDARKKTLFEYLLLDGINDDEKSAKTLAKLLNGIDAKVNLINFNSHSNSEFRRSSEENVKKFAKILQDKGIICTTRASRGADIDAACGQLRHQ